MTTHIPPTGFLIRPAFIEGLHHALIKEPMPGREAHFKMAHAIRRADVHPNPDEVKKAAVLITFFEKTPNDWHLVFIRRGSFGERDKHGGQIAFPGGKWEPGDRDLMFTALREAEEETALDLTTIDVLGQLTPLYITVSNFLVHPFVAYSYKAPVLIRQESEIEEILEFPVRSFFEKEAVSETRIKLGSGIVLNHVPSYNINGNIIWGATAMIMSELIDLVSLVNP